jgi:hypothetical protein
MVFSSTSPAAATLATAAGCTLASPGLDLGGGGGRLDLSEPGASATKKVSASHQTETESVSAINLPDPHHYAQLLVTELGGLSAVSR